MSKMSRKHLREISGPAWVWVSAAYDKGFQSALINAGGQPINREGRVNAGVLNIEAVADERHALALAELRHLAAACQLMGDVAGHDAVMLGHKAIIDLLGPATSPEPVSGAHR